MRLLIVRTSALGDVVHSLPVLSSLEAHLPEARIAWVVEEAFAPLLEGHPSIDELIPVRLKPWRRAPGSPRTIREVARFLGSLRSFRADVALNLMGNHKGGVLCALSGARRRIGLARTARREPSSVLWDTQTARPAGRHAIDRALAPLAPLGLPTEPTDLGGAHLRPRREGRPGGDRNADPDDPTGPFCLLHPGASWGNKVYPPERWARVVRGLREATGLTVRVALSPSPEERRLAHRIVELAQGTASVVDAADLRTLVEVSHGARLVLGGDTGPIHLAHALGTPVLCLMGPTDPELHGPYGHPERALARVLPCSFCYRRFESTKACLLELHPDEVVERAAVILLDSTTTNR